MKELSEFMKTQKIINLDSKEIDIAVEIICPRRVSVLDPDGNEAEDILMMERLIDGKKFFYLVNSNQNEKLNLVLKCPGQGLSMNWDFSNGDVKPIGSRKNGNSMEIPLVLEKTGCGPFISIEKGRPISIVKTPEPVRSISLGNKWEIKNVDHNAMTLDYCRFRLDKNAKLSGKVPVWKAQKDAVDKNAKSISLLFEFTSELSSDQIKNLYLVMESPEIFSIEINGKKIRYKDEGYWLDPEFKKI